MKTTRGLRCAVPDLTLTGGVRVLPDDGAVGFVVGVSIPLPFFSRNQGSIRAARFRVSEARARLRQARVRLASRMTQAHTTAAASAATLSRIDRTILPKARTGVTVALDAYREGRAGYLAVLDAQRTLVQLRVERLSALASLLNALAELELLVGRPLRAAAPKRAARPGNDTRRGRP